LLLLLCDGRLEFGDSQNLLASVVSKLGVVHNTLPLLDPNAFVFFGWLSRLGNVGP